MKINIVVLLLTIMISLVISTQLNRKRKTKIKACAQELNDVFTLIRKEKLSLILEYKDIKEKVSNSSKGVQDAVGKLKTCQSKNKRLFIEAKTKIYDAAFYSNNNFIGYTGKYPPDDNQHRPTLYYFFSADPSPIILGDCWVFGLGDLGHITQDHFDNDNNRHEENQGRERKITNQNYQICNNGKDKHAVEYLIDRNFEWIGVHNSRNKFVYMLANDTRITDLTRDIGAGALAELKPIRA